MVISKTYCFGSRESGVGSRKKEHPKIVYLDTFYHKMSGEPVVVPIHGNKDLPIGTLKNIMKDTNLTEDDLI
jgi:hypothetical protein